MFMGSFGLLLAAGWIRLICKQASIHASQE